VNLSVLMATYARDNPAHLVEALDSLLAQTAPADEVVLVEDGPIPPSLAATIEAYRGRLPLVSVRLEQNSGIGAALRTGLLQCRADLVARMDADDICVPLRFERQLAFLEQHREVDVVGGAIAEFLQDRSKVIAVRRPPENGEKLVAFAKLRCPLNHMTVMFRKDKVLRAGSYQAAPPFEDYHLWLRLLMDGCGLWNLQDVLVLARCGNGLQQRRGGLEYVRREFRFVRMMKQMGFLSALESARYLALHAPVRLIPPFVRGYIYQRWLRNQAGAAAAEIPQSPDLASHRADSSTQ
jgi:O104-antigen biosynthesis beta-1,3-galactosyltransferase